ncbi:MAG: DUF1080 domain-containing protein [Catalinimonas sp.]
MMRNSSRLCAYALLSGALAACGGSGANEENEVVGDTTVAQEPGTFEQYEDNMNVLTDAEAADGWQLLFDGRTTDGWRGAYADSFPARGWVVEDGQLIVLASDGSEGGRGGDIVTEEEYGNFELLFEFNITEGANSGVKYFVTEAGDAPAGSAYGLEFQILDDERHPDAKKGRDGNRTVGSLYDMMTAQGKAVNPPGEWNQGRLLVDNGKVEHWLNGRRVIEYERGSEAFRKMVGESKYAASSYNEFGRFGEAEQGHLLLQDHGDRVAFRNIKIRRLSTEQG